MQIFQKVTQCETPGEKGEKTIVYTVTYTDRVETKREKKSESVTKQPVEEVVEVGTKKAPVVTTSEVTETEEIPFTSREERMQIFQKVHAM